MLQPAATPVRTMAAPQSQVRGDSQTEIKSAEESPSVSSPSSSSNSAADVSTSDKPSGHHEHSPQEQAEQLQNLMAEIRHLQKYGTRRTRRYLNKMNLVDNPTKEDIERMISIYNKAAKSDKNFLKDTKRRPIVELTSSSECCDFCCIRKHQQSRDEEARSRLQRVQKMREQMQEAKQSQKTTKSTPSSTSTGRGSTAAAAKSAANKERPKDQRRAQVSNRKTTKNEPCDPPAATRKAAPSKPAAAKAAAAQPPVDQHDAREISPGEVIEDLDCRCERCRGKTDAPSKQPVPVTKSTPRSSSSTKKSQNSPPSKEAVKDPEAAKKDLVSGVKEPSLPASPPKSEGAKRTASAPVSSTKQGKVAVKMSESPSPNKDASANVKIPAASATPSKATPARRPVAQQRKVQASSSSQKPQNSASTNGTTKAAEVAKKGRAREQVKQQPSSGTEVASSSSSKPRDSDLKEDSSESKVSSAPGPSSSLQTTEASTQNDASDKQSWTESFGKRFDTFEKALSEVGLGGLRSDRSSVSWKEYLKKEKALLKKLDRAAFFESMEQYENERALCQKCLVEEMAKYEMEPTPLPPQYNLLYASLMKRRYMRDATRSTVGAQQCVPDIPCARHSASTGPKQDASSGVDLEADATDTDDSGEDLSGMYFIRNCDSIYRSSRPVGAYVMLRVAQAKAYDGNLEEEMKKQLVQRRAALDHKANAFL